MCVYSCFCLHYNYNKKFVRNFLIREVPNFNKFFYMNIIPKTIADIYEKKTIRLQMNNTGQLLIKTYIWIHQANQMSLV